MSAQLDMFKPVQLDMRLDGAITAKHLTDLECHALAQVLVSKCPRAGVPMDHKLDAMIDPYNLDADSKRRVMRYMIDGG